MQKYIKHELDKLTLKNPNWDKEVSDYVKTDEEVGKESFNQLAQILLQIVSQIRDKRMTKKDLEQIFFDYQHYNSFNYIINFVWNKISVYADYSPLRDMCQSDKYMAEKIVDIIWNENIYRLNPYLIWKDKIGVEDDSIYENLTNRLGKYVVRSVRYSLTYDAMVESLKKDSELPDEMCRYIAKKIDENMKELKINYILDRLMRLDDNIEALLDDDAMDE